MSKSDLGVLALEHHLLSIFEHWKMIGSVEDKSPNHKNEYECLGNSLPRDADFVNVGKSC